MIGELIRLYRSVNNVGIRELAKDLDMSAATLSRIENGYACDQEKMLNLIKWLFSVNNHDGRRKRR